MISKENVYSRIEQSGNLPTLPAILLKLLAACDKDDTPMSEIAAIINKDPVLSCKVLQLVNSAYYGFRHSFTGMDKAVVYLGANTLKNIALTMSVHQVFEQKRFKNVGRFTINVFWYQSLMCATLARRIAQKIGFADMDEAYLSGLLHNIGRLLLIATFPKEHESILAQPEDGLDTLWAETQLLGVTHCEIGSWLIQNWHMSSVMADAVRYHHEPLEKIKEAFPLVQIVYLANLLGENSDNVENIPAIDGLLTGLQHSDLQTIVEGAAEEVEQIAASLEIVIQKPSEASDAHAISAAKQSERAPVVDATQDKEKALQEDLKARIKSVSLLSNFLLNLAQADDITGIIAACEQTMRILFNIEKVLFFLTDPGNILLKGQTSSANSLQQTSRGLTLTLQQSSSLIVKTYHDMSAAYLTAEKSMDNLAEMQILTIMQSSTVLLVPLVADHKPAGVILLGLPQNLAALSASDNKLVQVVAQQAGLCLQLERIKEQRAAELEAARRAAISLTARKVAHEINNPLGIISNYITSIKLKLTDEAHINNDLTVIDEEIHRISMMIRQLDLFSQDSKYSFAFTDVNATIADIIQLIKAAHFARPEIVISFHPDDNLPHIFTAKDALKQIVINLLKNSAEAMNNGGSITVTTRQADKEKFVDGQGIEIVVADSGPGLPESVSARLYSPFVTTKSSGHSGLGLSIVHKTVEDLGGTLSCTSSPTNGTRFSIILPSSAPDELR
jgi:HD-like signal output (HDOD) protein/signal transduction histidine kinase